MTDRVYVYWNLHKDLFSVRDRGKVRAHTSRISLQNVVFSVSEAGRQRVLRERSKNVHAGLRGVLVTNKNDLKLNGWRRITYNPYLFNHFVTVNGKHPVLQASHVVGRVVKGKAQLYAKGLVFLNNPG